MTCVPQDATHKVHGNVKKRFGSPTIDSANLQLSAPASNLILEDFRRQACFGAGVAPAQQREAAAWPAAATAFHGLPSCKIECLNQPVDLQPPAVLPASERLRRA
jgi:hypothetical protein